MSSHRFWQWTASALGYSVLIFGPLALADDSVSGRNFGGPDAVENVISDDAKPISALIKERVTDPWFEWKKGLQEETGFSFGVDYSSLLLTAEGSTGNDNASGGMARLFGAWDLVGRGTKDTGALVWKVEHRHRYGSVAPGGFGLGQLGYVGVVGGPWSNQGLRLSNLYWRQRFNDGKATFVGGYLDVTDYVDTFVGGSPWTGFVNLAFSTGSASMFVPNEATLGAAVGVMATDNIYMIGGLANAYSDPTDPFDDSFDRLFGDGELFTSLELGWTSSHERIYQDNTHVTFWHVDDSPDAGAVNGWGVAFSHVRHIDDHWMPFVRGGYADDGGSLLQKSLSVGFLYQDEPGADLLGVGLNWGEPNESSFGPGLDDQYTAEVFYRIPVTQQLAVTPSIEYIKDPALNPNNDSVWIAGVRVRLAL
jgi:porin